MSANDPKLDYQGIGGRTAITFLAVAVWFMVVSSVDSGSIHWAERFLIALTILLVGVRLGVWLDRKALDAGRDGDATKLFYFLKVDTRMLLYLLEFIWYVGFIYYVAYYSVKFGGTHALWYGIPPSLTLGIIPQIANPRNKGISISLSVIIYAFVLWQIADVWYFFTKDIVWYYVVVVITTTSVWLTERIMKILAFVASLISSDLDKITNNKIKHGK